MMPDYDFNDLEQEVYALLEYNNIKNDLFKSDILEDITKKIRKVYKGK